MSVCISGGKARLRLDLHGLKVQYSADVRGLPQLTREAALQQESDPERSQRSRKALIRLPTYRGVAREIGWIAFNAALWPLGLVDETVRASWGRLKRNGTSEVRQPDSDAAAMPIVLIHGYFHNRSGMLVMQRALRKQGFRHVHTVSYVPLRRTIPEIAELVSCKINDLLERAGTKKVHIIGHSLGGILGRYYVEQMGGAEKVHTLITLGTPHHGTMIAYAGRSPAAKQLRPGSQFMRELADGRKPESVRYVSYYSNIDILVVPTRSAILENGDASSVRNILLPDLGHLSLLISPELVASITQVLAVSGSNRRS